MDWIYIVEDKAQWRILVNIPINIGFLESREQPVRTADNLIAICEPTV
jgi:hypothetical protein